MTAITIVLSLLPSTGISEENIPDIPHLDKIVHLVLYALLGFTWTRALRCNKISWILIGSLAILGTILECVQFLFLEGRFFEILDIIANIGGSMLGALSYIILAQRRL